MSQKKPARKSIVCPQCGGPKTDLSSICRNCWAPSRNRIEDVLTGIANSKTMKEIAIDLGISIKTVEYHWYKGKVKYGLQCPQDATKLAIRMGWITCPVECSVKAAA